LNFPRFGVLGFSLQQQGFAGFCFVGAALCSASMPSLAYQEPRQCPIAGCAYAANNKRAYEAHQRKHNGETPYACGLAGCSYATHSIAAVTVHRKRHDLPRPFRCAVPLCDFAGRGSNALARHMRVHNTDPQGRFSCPVPHCGFSSAQRSVLKGHAQALHGGGDILGGGGAGAGEGLGGMDFQCSKCGSALGSREEHRRHVSQHRIDKMNAALAVKRAAKMAASAEQAAAGAGAGGAAEAEEALQALGGAVAGMEEV